MNRNETIMQRICYVLLSVLLVLFSIAFGGSQAVSPVYAESEKEYTNVLTDLQKDKTFDKKSYPEQADDYSLKIIQVAESSDKEVFIYVYQPSGKGKDLKASSINISTTINDNIHFYNYKLRFLNSDGTLYKYIVEDFTVSDAPTRYYAISSIYRPFDENIDQGADHGNTVTEVNYAVDKQYCFSTINGKPYCSVVDIESIVVTDKFCGFVRYSNGFKLYNDSCDSHFVAFNTDKPIDKLLEADVYYTEQSYYWSFQTFIGEKEIYGEKQDKYAYLNYTQRVEHTGNGWFAGTYTWDRIETTEQFIAENDLTQNVYSGAVIDVNLANKITEEGKAALRDKKWILRFTETSYSFSVLDNLQMRTSTIIGDVTILRLKFETDGITYNLGVIDNKQSGSDKPINEEETQIEVKDNFLAFFLALAVIVVLLLILAPILPGLINAIVWLISLPFKGMGALFKAIKNRFHKRE